MTSVVVFYVGHTYMACQTTPYLLYILTFDMSASHGLQ